MSSAALNIGANALTANMSALQVIGHNIANVNTEGYSRQIVQPEIAGYQKLGGLFYGKGVTIESVERAHDEFLTKEARQTASIAAADATRLTQMQRLESLFPIGEDGLGSAINDMLNAWQDVSSSPSDLSARVVAISRGEDLAARFRDTAAQMDSLSSSSRQQAVSTVENINRLTSQIAELNQRILETQGSAGTPNDLLDQRDQLLKDLSQHVQISTVQADDGMINVFVGGSQPLVLGRMTNTLEVTRDDMDASISHITFNQSGYSIDVKDSSLGGELGGLMVFLNNDLRDISNELGRMALAISEAMNAQHQLGVDLQGNPGSDFFVAPTEATGYPSSANTGDGVVTADVVDATALKASDYLVTYDGSGVTIRRMSDNTTSSFAGLPAEFDGLNFDLPSGTPNAGDTFLIRPYESVARNLQVAISAPDQLAVASPVQITPAATNNGGIGIESLYPVSASPNLTDTVTITFQADGSFEVTGLGPDNPPPDNFGPPDTYNYTPGQPIVFNGWSLTLRGSPAAGDSFDITAASPTLSSQNGGNAEAMLALRDLATFDGVSLSEGYSSLISNLGTKVQGAQFSANYSSGIATSAEAARSSVAGVNLDEEAARLLQFQQAYQAAAKYMQMAQTNFDTLLQSLR